MTTPETPPELKALLDGLNVAGVKVDEVYIVNGNDASKIDENDLEGWNTWSAEYKAVLAKIGVDMDQSAIFDFCIGDKVKIAVSGEEGEVIGRAEYAASEDSYYLRYKAGDGRAIEAWWPVSALELVEKAGE